MLCKKKIQASSRTEGGTRWLACIKRKWSSRKITEYEPTERYSSVFLDRLRDRSQDEPCCRGRRTRSSSPGSGSQRASPQAKLIRSFHQYQHRIEYQTPYLPRRAGSDTYRLDGYERSRYQPLFKTKTG